MDNKSIDDIRFDRRMVNRRDWIKPEDLARELESLPDVSDKAERPEEGESGDGADPVETS